MNKKGILVVVSGFSGAGKGCLMKALLNSYDCYALSVSATTRDPREGEINGREYFFVTEERFREMIEAEIKKERAAGVRDFFFVEAALLIECGYDEVVDEMWYIYCDPDERRRRLKASRGYSDEKIDSILKSQLSHEAFLAGTDVMIDNSGTPQESFAAIDREMARLMRNR